MIPYLLMAIIPIAFMICKHNIVVLGFNTNDKTEDVGLMIFTLIVLFFTCCRSRYLGSTDTVKYYSLIKLSYSFDSLRLFLDYSESEKGFIIWIWTLSRIFIDPQIIMIINAALIFLPTVFFIKKYSDDVYFSCFLFITFCTYRFSLQGMRQSMAMAVCLVALDFANKRKFLPFVLFVLLAMTFHKSAIIFFPVYFIFEFGRKNKDKMPLIICTSLTLVFAGGAFLGIANSYMGDKGYGEILAGGLPTSMIYLLLFAGIIITYKKFRDDYFKISMAYMTIVSIAFYFTRYTVAHAAERIGYYFQFSLMITIPQVLSFINVKEKTIYKFIVILVIFALYIYQLSGSDLIPYKFFWDYRI